MIRHRALKACVVSGLLMLVAGGGFAQEPAGEVWNFTMALQMDGTTMPMPPQMICVKPEEAATPAMANNCKFSDLKTAGSTTRFSIVCGPPQPMTGTAEVTRTGDRTEGRYAMKSAGGEMTMAFSGRKLGSCTP